MKVVIKDMEQLTMFEVLEQFDPNLAKWDNVLNCFEKCTVLAYIPQDALSPLEQWRRKYNPDDYKLWGNYAMAIWRRLGHSDKAWSIACNMLQEYRDSNRPCLMQINRSIEFPDRYYFKPDRVAEYLD